MIYSAYGAQIEIVGGSISEGLVSYRFIGEETIRKNAEIVSLKADNGLNEIHKAITKANNSKLRDFRTCKRAWYKENRVIDGKPCKINVLHTAICAKCSDLDGCLASVNVAAHIRLTGRP